MTKLTIEKDACGRLTLTEYVPFGSIGMVDASADYVRDQVRDFLDLPAEESHKAIAADLARMNESLTKKLSLVERERDDLKERVEATERVSKQRLVTVNECQSRLLDKHQRIRALQGENDQLKKELEALRKARELDAELLSGHEVSLGEVLRLKTATSEIKHSLDVMVVERDKLAKENSILESELSRRENQGADLRELQVECGKLRQTNLELDGEVKHLSERLEKSQGFGAVENVDEEIDRLRRMVGKIAEERDRWRREADAQSNHRITLEMEKQHMERIIQDASEVLDNL